MRSLLSLVVAGVLVALSPAARADDRDETSGTDDRWTSHPLTIGTFGTADTPPHGNVIGLEADYAPRSWLYASVLGGSDGDSSAYAFGGAAHVRYTSGWLAIGLGGGFEQIGAHDVTTTDTDFLGPTITNAYSFGASAWATGDVTIEARTADGLSVRLAVGIEIPIASGTYTCMSTNADNGLFGSNVPTTTDCSGAVGKVVEPFAGLMLGYSPRLASR